MSGVSEAGIRILADLMMRETGNRLSLDKAYMIEGRLLPLVKLHGAAGIDDLARRIERPGNDGLRSSIIERLTTHETYFFRDRKPFEILRSRIIPKLAASAAAGRSLKIWSAACSTGQEPYSMAILLAELAAAFPKLRYDIIATDVSAETVEKARAGVYNEFEIDRGLRPGDVEKYFTADGPRGWRVNDSLRRNLTFRVENLARPRVPLNSQDIILCRYVLIYMERPLRVSILSGLADRLRGPESRLLLGTSESTIGLGDRFEWQRAEGAGTYGLTAGTGAVGVSDRPGSHGSTSFGRALGQQA